MRTLSNSRGFTLIELVIVIIIISVLAGIASMQFFSKLDSAKYSATMAEMNAIAFAIAGNPDIYANGARSDFGYVGDIGAMPPSLDALAANPGYSTWDGPYIRGDFDSDDFKRDAWNVEYVFIDTLLRSTGSGENIEKIIASNTSAFLSNSVAGFIRDADQNLPGPVYKDSFAIIFAYPDGSGSMATASTLPDAGGYFSFSGIPIGNHTLTVIYIPDTDTVIYRVGVYPGRDAALDIIFPADLW